MPTLFLSRSETATGLPKYEWIPSAESAAFFTHRLDAMLAVSTVMVTTRNPGVAEIRTKSAGERTFYFVEMTV